MATTITTGDDVALTITLKVDNKTFVIDNGATVQASIISPDHLDIYHAPVLCSNSATGADWTNSKVVVEFTSAQTETITSYGDAILEVQVDDSGKSTFFANIGIVKGTIL